MAGVRAREEGETLGVKVDLKARSTPDAPSRVKSVRDLALNVHESIREQLYLKAKRFKKV